MLEAREGAGRDGGCSDEATDCAPDRVDGKENECFQIHRRKDAPEEQKCS